MSLERLIRKKEADLTMIDWQIYDYLISNSPTHLTLSMVANHVHVSTTTIFRFCQKLGLSGFSELKVVLKESGPPKIVRRELVQAMYHDIVNYIQEFDIRALKKRLEASQELYIFARSELELRLAKAFQRIFFPLDKAIFILPNTQSLVSTFSSISNQILFILSIDSQEEFPTILKHKIQMDTLYTVVLSDVRYLSQMTISSFQR